MDRKVILGSASPRRRELLAQIGVEFEVRVSDKEEIYHSEIPEEIVKELALMKAENVMADMTVEQVLKKPATEKTEETEDRQTFLKSTVIIGADTVVVLDDKILGKPKDEEDAFRMIQSLQGRGHEVYTGVAVIEFDSEGKRSTVNHAVGTKVYVNAMTEEEIHAYIATGEPVDKAGAYGIQGRFAPFIDRIEGDYYNVVGLPVSYVYQVLFKRS
ncbi:MAG TPA: septum formation protein Maf [Candidatus Mediterraneibacter merdavium]|nr:septum formation protein Maf [Candidatus Mediterraneibacter merdavium]